MTKPTDEVLILKDILIQLRQEAHDREIAEEQGKIGTAVGMAKDATKEKIDEMMYSMKRALNPKNMAGNISQMFKMPIIRSLSDSVSSIANTFDNFKMRREDSGAGAFTPTTHESLDEEMTDALGKSSDDITDSIVTSTNELTKEIHKLQHINTAGFRSMMKDGFDDMLTEIRAEYKQTNELNYLHEQQQKELLETEKDIEYLTQQIALAEQEGSNEGHEKKSDPMGLFGKMGNIGKFSMGGILLWILKKPLFWLLKKILPTTIKDFFKRVFSETIPKFFKETIPKFFKEDIPRFFKEKLPRFFKSLPEKIGGFFKGIFEHIGEFFGKIINKVMPKNGTFEYILELMGEALGNVGTIGKLFLEKVGGLFGERIGTFFGEFFPKIFTEFLPKFLPRVLRGALRLTELVPFLGEIIMGVFAIFDFKSGWKNASKIMGKDKNKLTFWDKMKAGLAEVVSGLLFGLMPTKWVVKLGGWLYEKVFTPIGHWIKKAWNGLKAFFTWKHIGHMLLKVKGVVWTMETGVKAYEIYTKIKDWIIEKISALWTSTKSTISDVVGSVIDYVKEKSIELFKYITTTDWSEKLKSVCASIWQLIKDGFLYIVDLPNMIFDNVMEFFKSGEFSDTMRKLKASFAEFKEHPIDYLKYLDDPNAKKTQYIGTEISKKVEEMKKADAEQARLEKEADAKAEQEAKAQADKEAKENQKSSTQSPVTVIDNSKKTTVNGQDTNTRTSNASYSIRTAPAGAH